jgi:hypothetical protein
MKHNPPWLDASGQTSTHEELLEAMAATDCEPGWPATHPHYKAWLREFAWRLGCVHRGTHTVQSMRRVMAARNPAFWEFLAGSDGLEAEPDLDDGCESEPCSCNSGAGEPDDLGDDCSGDHDFDDHDPDDWTPEQLQAFFRYASDEISHDEAVRLGMPRRDYASP